MVLDRRAFFTIGPLALGALGSYFYLDNESMVKAPKKDGFIAADLHAHIKLPGSSSELEEILKECVGRIIGLTYKKDHNVEYISYDSLVGSAHSPVKKFAEELSLKVDEIGQGFAKFELNGETGYLARSQEVASDFHILALFSRGLIENYADSIMAVDSIHENSGISIFCHPYVKMKGSGNYSSSEIVPPRTDKSSVQKAYNVVSSGYVFNPNDKICPEDEKKIEILFGITDQPECFSGNSINALWIGHREANEKALEGARAHEKKGIATTDAHTLQQVATSAIYLPKNCVQSVESLKTSILAGDYELYCRYVSRGSFIRGQLNNIF